MNELDKLMAQYPQIDFQFKCPPLGLDGLTVGNRIIINKNLSEEEKLECMYEELGHVFTTAGDIADYSADHITHDELKARKWGMRHYVPKEKMDKIAKKQFETDDEAAADLGVQTDYLHEVGLMYGFGYKW